jgi:uncharacterized protein
VNTAPPARSPIPAANPSRSVRAIRPPILCLLLIAALATAAGCSKPYQPALPTVQVALGSRQYILEIAADDATRQKGLMDRDFMPPNYGMLFVFTKEEPLTFYMKNTHIPLDILFLDKTGRVVSISTMQPFDLRLTPSNGPATYAIELNAGQAALTGLAPGGQVNIPPAATTQGR